MGPYLGCNIVAFQKQLTGITLLITKISRILFLMCCAYFINKQFYAQEIISGCHLLSRWYFSQLIFSTLNMEAICSSETSDDTQRITRRYIPKAVTLHNHRCENLKSYIIMSTISVKKLLILDGKLR
jgi:hypothetical protein